MSESAVAYFRSFVSIYGQVLGGTKHDSCYQRLRIEVSGEIQKTTLWIMNVGTSVIASQADAFSAVHFITQLNLALPQRSGRPLTELIAPSHPHTSSLKEK